MNLLDVENLSVSIGEKKIISNLTLSIGKGEVHVIMGQNGSGKSTLLSALCGNPKFKCSGSAKFEGKEMLSKKPHERARAGLFLAFQSPVEVPGVTLSGFLRQAYASKAGKPVSVAEFSRLLDEKASLVGVDRQFFERGVNEGASGGERKMGEILQMAVLEPKLGMLDELDSGLDVDALARISAAVGKIRKKDGSLLLVTHYARILKGLRADKVHVMHQGRIVASGDEKLARKIEEKGYEWVLR